MITDPIRRHPHVLNSLTRASDGGLVLGSSDPIRCEVLGGLLNVNGTQKLQLFRETITPLMDRLSPVDAD